MEFKCAKCGCAVLADSVVCTRCGAPRTSIQQNQVQPRSLGEQTNLVAQGQPSPTPVVPVTAAQPLVRKVGVGLGLGIFFVPHVFSWFLLRPGYSRSSRLIAFSWLGVALLAVICM